jgi:hypothetical protein
MLKPSRIVTQEDLNKGEEGLSSRDQLKGLDLIGVNDSLKEKRTFSQGDLSKGDKGVSPRDQFSSKEKRSKWETTNIFGKKDKFG